MQSDGCLAPNSTAPGREKLSLQVEQDQIWLKKSKNEGALQAKCWNLEDTTTGLAWESVCSFLASLGDAELKVWHPKGPKMLPA